jgi:hypothetical protein
MVTRTNLSALEQSPRPGGARIIADASRTSDGPGPEVMDADTLIGDKVVNPAGDDLGKIEAIMLDVAAGRVAYAVLSFGGFLGMGSKYFAIPWGAFTLDAVEKRFVLDVSTEKLERAEGFDRDRWPSMADPDWAKRVHEYYEVPPYWTQDYASPDVRRGLDEDLPGYR